MTSQVFINLKNFLGPFGYGVFVFVGILVLTFLASRIVRLIFSKKKKFVRIDSTQYKFLSHFLSGVIYFIGFLTALYSIPQFRGLALSITASSGVLAIVLGFASRQAFSNIISGIFIAIYKPFRIGDRIRLTGGNFYGKIEDINLRHTIIKTFENKRIIIPNSLISSQVIENENVIDTKIRNFYEIPISYDSDVQLAKKIIKEEVMKHPEYLDNRSKKEIKENEDPVPVRVLGYGDFSVNLRAWVWVKDPGSAYVMECELNEKIKERFDAEGIEIPFPYRTIVMKEKPKKRGKK